MISSVPLVELTKNFQTQISVLKMHLDYLSITNNFLYHLFKYNWALLLMLIKITDLMMLITLFQTLMLVQEMPTDNMYCKIKHWYKLKLFNSPIILMKKTYHVISPTILQTLLSYLKMHRVNLSLQIINPLKSLEVVLVQ